MTRPGGRDRVIKKLIEDGVSVNTIAERIGKHPDFVYKKLSRMGLKQADRPEPVGPKVVLPPSRPRCIVRKERPPPSERVEFTKPELMRMLADAVKNTR